MMKLYFVFSLAVICVAAAVAISQAPDSKFKTSDNAAAGRYIVLLNEKLIPAGASPSAVETQSAELATFYGASIDKTFSAAVKGFSASMSESQALALSNDARVQLVEVDRVISVSSQQLNAPWNLDRVDQRNLPWDNTYDYTGTGAGVHVYIIDTGIRVTHSDFSGRASVAYDNVGDGQNGNDCNGHGTHVAGIVGGSSWGIAKQALLHAVRVLPCSGSGFLSNVIAGVDWVTANHIGPAVANISAATLGSSMSLETAITNSIASGVVYTIAAGNSASDACSFTPARTQNAITVAASDETDLRALYSNYGQCIDIFAPGNRVVSAWASSDTATANLSGSSMAAPMVAGAAALYLGMNPGAAPSAVAQAIKANGTPNVLDTLDITSPNLLLYSRFGPGPTTTAVTITGRVMNSGGRGIRGISLTLSDPLSGTITVARTNLFGTYRFTDVAIGQSYLLTAIPNRRFQIADNVRSMTVMNEMSEVNFLADTFIY